MAEDWVSVFETFSRTDADLARATLEGAGFQVWVRGDTGLLSEGPLSYAGFISLSVPSQKAADARALLEGHVRESPSRAASSITIHDVCKEILNLRKGPAVGGCKYCGIPTLDLSEAELDSRQVVLLRAAGLGVNSSSYTDFEPDERICTDCAAHEVECDVCGRTTDGYVDGGLYRYSGTEEGYVCSICSGQIADALEPNRDW